MWREGVREVVGRTHIVFALECALASLLSFVCAYSYGLLVHSFTPLLGGLWGAISTAMVVDVLSHEALKMSFNRLIGSTIGCLSTLIWLYVFGYDVFAFLISTFFAVIMCYVFRVSQTYRTTLIAVFVVIVSGALMGSHISIWGNVLNRFVDSIIGIVTTLIVVFLFYPLRSYFNLLAR